MKAAVTFPAGLPFPLRKSIRGAMPFDTALFFLLFDTLYSLKTANIRGYPNIRSERKSPSSRALE